jgi:Ca-activated chloride channel family protein
LLSFSNPILLLLLLLVPPLVWWWLRRGERALRFSATSIMEGLPAGREKWLAGARAGLRATGLVLLIVAVSGPRWPDPGTRIPARGIAIAMVVDVSGSMANRDFFWDQQLISRLDAVKRAFRLLVEGDGNKLEGRPQDLISLVTYATRPDTACPLTLDHAALLKTLDAQEPRTLITEATTNTGDAIAWALHGLNKAPGKRKVMILLTDGEHNVGSPALKPTQAAQLAGNLGIPIYTIHALGESADPDEASKQADENLRAKKSLQQVAAITGGQYFQANDTAMLLDVCQKIDRLERARIESFQYRRYEECFAWLATTSLLVWMTILILETTVWRKVP